MSRESQIQTGRTGLVIELMQNDACHRNGIYARNGVTPESIELMVPTMVRVALVCRERRIPIIATRLTILTDLDGRAVGAGPIVAVRPFLLRDGLRDGSWGHQLIEALPRPDYEIRQWVYSSFYRTEFEHVVEALQLRHLVFMGIATEIAVETTAREAIIRDFDVTVLSDCVRTYDERLQVASLTTMARLARVMTANDFLARLGAASSESTPPSVSVTADGHSC
jgi:nicotinamidase-related amidase